MKTFQTSVLLIALLLGPAFLSQVLNPADAQVAIPSHPQNLAATAASSSEIDLSWNAPSSDGGSPVTAYRIQISTDDATWTTIVKNTGNTNTSYSDTGLSSGVKYYYRVFALNSVGSSYNSNIASATTFGGSLGEITVYAHRIPAPYWDPCFATTCKAGTGPGASMYFVLYDINGNFLQDGYADENGYSFTGLDPASQYYVYAANCDSCHGSTHDVVFRHWGNDSTADPRLAKVSAKLNAWYACTNSCSGG